MKNKRYTLIIFMLISAIVLPAWNLGSAQSPQQTVLHSSKSTPQVDTTLDLCISDEPESLYYYSAYQTIWQAQILSAVYDGPMDNRSYSHQAIIFESVPTFENNGVITETLTVTQGDMIVDGSGYYVVPLEIGTSYLPSGCYESSCSAIYTGGLVVMEQLVVTQTLKSGLTWSDGHPLTSNDMLYSFDLNADPDTPAYKSQVERTYFYIATSPTQTVWAGLPGYFPYDYSVMYWMPLPEHVWSVYTPLELVTAEVSNRTPLGWGAYVIDEWVPGDHIQMHKNPLYFRANEGLPHFDSLIVHFGTELAGILNGTCDVVPNSMDDFKTLQDYDDKGLLEVIAANDEYWERLDFGIQSSDVYTGFAALTDAFQDVKVRQAFAYCLDRQAIADLIYPGMGKVPNAFLPDDHPYFPPDAVIYPHNVTQGKSLLDAAGWTDNNGNGIRDKDGYEFLITLMTTTRSQRYQITSMIAAQMAACGIQVTPIHMSPAEFFASWPDGPLSGRKFDLAEYAMGGFRPPQCSEYLSWNISSDENPGGWNNTGYAKPEFDLACSNALGSLPEADRVENYRSVTRLFTEELPSIHLFWYLVYGITAPHITGFMLDTSDSYNFWCIEDLNIGVQELIPPGGGVLTSTLDNTSYAFSDGTFNEPVVITHTALSPVVLPDFGGLAGAGHFFSLEGTLNGQPVEPSLPYTMTIGYTDDEHSYVYEDTLGLYYWNGENWAIEPTAVVDTLNNIIIATPGHFSYWAVLGEPYTTIYLPVIRR